MKPMRAATFAPLWLLLLTPLLGPALGLNSDGVLLLSFKYSVLSDPLSVLGDWSCNDNTPCSWNGVMCMELPWFTGQNTSTASSWGSNSNTTTETDYRVISLVLPDSQLLGSISPDLGLLQHLRHLDLSGNFLNGTLPNSLFNASSSELRILSLSNNEISGVIPDLDPGRLTALQVLNLSDNALVGRVPTNLTLLPNLTAISLANNYLSGHLPGGGFPRLQVLDLSSNLLNGSLPADLAGGRLRYLNLSYNRLAGRIPPELGSRAPAGAMLDLSFNNLTGQIPQSGAFLSQKSAFFAGNPDLCGRPLRNLCTIPSTLSDPPPNVSTTNPEAPKSPPAFAAIPRDPNGDSPGGAAEGDRGSAGQGGLRPAAIAAITIGDLGVIGLLFLVFLYVFQVKRKKKQQQQQQLQGDPKSNQKSGITEKQSAAASCCLRKKGSDSEETSETSGTDAEDEQSKKESKAEAAAAAGKSEAQQQQKREGTMLVTVDGEMELELETLLKASAYILGARDSSIVYKAVLADGTPLAIRRIGENSAIHRLKDFDAQVRSIAKLRHPNLLPLRGFYWGIDEKLLIHDYAPNGSLANISFSKKLGSSPFHLSWEARVRIARGVARGLAFLHEKKCVHGNLKPSNILLGADMEPWIGDLGLERLIVGDSSGKSARHFGSKRSTQSLPELSPAAAGASPYCSSSAGSGVAPYQAPESLRNLKPSFKWDVYSFGMVLLELVSGRLYSETELFQWNAGFVVEERNRVLRMADPALRGEVEGKEEGLLVCFKLGFACASVGPQRRPSMKDAVQVLDKMPPSAY